MTHDATPAERLYTINEAAEYLRVSRGIVYGLIKQGDLPALRVGQRLRIRSADLTAFVDQLLHAE